jgi:arylsulfatase
LTDDQGYSDLGCYGSPDIRTPNVDGMARDGVRFTQFYSPSPLCTPARAGLLTGCYPMRVGMNDFPVDPGQASAKSSHVLYPNSPLGLNPAEMTIPRILKTAGYACDAVGKWHLGDRREFLPLRHGFDSYFGMPNVNDQKPLYFVRDDARLDEPVDLNDVTRRYTREAVEVIRRRAREDKPFFLYLAHTMPHWPLGVSESFRGKSAGGVYGDVIEELDWSVGELLRTLKELGLDDNTLVVFTSDNGPWLQKGEEGGNARPLRGGKGTTYEGGMRVPCVVRWPAGRLATGKTCDALATLMDLLPTFAAVTGTTAAIPAGKPIDGKDITSLLRDPTSPSPHAFFLYYGDENRLNAVRAGRWKLKLQTTLQEETHYGKMDHPDAKIPEKLFDLERDPGEQKSLLKDHPDVAKQLRAIADRAREELGDARVGKIGKDVRPIGRASTPKS